MSISIKKLNDDVFEVTVAKTSTTTHTVTVTDQSLTDLTDDNATKAQHLNSKNITTFTGKEWKGNHVFALLKRYRKREERLSRREEVFEPEISKFEVRWEKER